MNFTYTDVKHFKVGMELNIGATIIETNSPIIIVKSISSIYRRQLTNDTTHMLPVTFKDQDVLNALRNLVLGGEYARSISVHDKERLNNTFIRVGWLDKKLVQLKWVPVVDLVQRFVDGTLTPTEKSKFREVTKALSLGFKEARTFHGTQENRYNPKRVLGVNNG